jgi:hypothetical protein
MQVAGIHQCACCLHTADRDFEGVVYSSRRQGQVMLVKKYKCFGVIDLTCFIVGTVYKKFATVTLLL